MNSNPIFIVDDDPDDEFIIREVFRDLGVENEVFFFHTAEGLLTELRTKKLVPFLIISDINLPLMDGLELRRQIVQDDSISGKTIPFIFWSTTASDAQVRLAYDYSAHGFFIKGRTYSDVRDEIEEILKYWNKSLSPQ